VNRPNKRQDILNHALELFVTKGIDQASTAEIAKGAGVATGTLFHHFPNKSSLVDALYRDLKTELASGMSGVISDDLLGQAKSYWDRALNWFLNHPAKLIFLQMYYLNPRISEERKELILRETFGFLYSFIEEGQDQQLWLDLPMTFLLTHFQTAILSTAQYLTAHQERQTEDFMNEAFRFHIRAALRAPERLNQSFESNTPR